MNLAGASTQLRTVNLYDSAIYESFIKMLTREAIYANEYQALEYFRSKHRGIRRALLEPEALAFCFGVSFARIGQQAR
jgi:hypothetical protein